MSRIRELDALRGIAALGVVVHHAVFLTGALSASMVDHLRSTPLQVVIAGRPLVLLFFVLSGFALSCSLTGQPATTRAYAAWVTRRGIRLLLPALASVLLSAILYHIAFSDAWSGRTVWLSNNWREAPDLSRILLQGFLLQDSDLNGVLWSLVVEVRIAIFIPLIVWFVRHRSFRDQLALLFLAVGMASLCGGTWPSRLGYSMNLLDSLQATPYFFLPFVLGILLHRSGVCAMEVDRRLVWAAAFTVFGFARAPGEFAAIVGSAVLVWLVQQPGRISAAMRTPVVRWLGKISFSLYLVHVPLTSAAFDVLHGELPDLAIAALAIAMSLPVAMVFHATVERPSQRLARAITAVGTGGYGLRGDRFATAGEAAHGRLLG